VNSIVNAIANRLSLRTPQRESLEILARVCDVIPLKKGADVADALKTIQTEYPSVTDFERDFPSLCFALATGVGKTRLMGAFIAYLYKAEGVRHFFVLAPNLTIYNKLITDFTPNTAKYVFQGIAEFAVNLPEIITGDNYESGFGVKKENAGFKDNSIQINIFNISKITSTETPKGAAKSNVPRFRRLQEYIGQSYFEYLSKLDDLVLLMDESHRYRASAGIKAISELKPILGLELTATPHMEHGGKTKPFRNVIYNYPLSNALTDGFVKEPAVATRENFNPRNYDAESLERLKLEDGIKIHEETRKELDVYSHDNGKPAVKPFMLIIARDTDHAKSLMKTMENKDFFEGRYRGKVIQVHSQQSGEEKDENIEKLINVEKPDNTTEIVIHVNMLKEGWDVTNLYTIVPLRAANSRTLVEQSIGRGLRLPYGKRTGVGAVDRLTIVSHDKFQEIVDYANSPDSIIRGGIKIVYVKSEGSRVVTAEPEIMRRIAKEIKSSKEQEAAKATLEIIRNDYEHLPNSSDLKKPEVYRQIVEKVRQNIAWGQEKLEGGTKTGNVSDIVEKIIDLRNEFSIDIPRITIQPAGDVKRGFKEFNLDLSDLRLQPVDNKILIQELQRREQLRLELTVNKAPEERPEDYLVRGLTDFDDISYDNHAELLYKLAGQVVAHLRSYLKSEEAVRNVLQYHNAALINIIHDQMQSNYEEKATAYNEHVTKGFTVHKSVLYSVPSDEPERDFRTPVPNKQDIRRMCFGGFKKCCYSIQKFDSDPERGFAVILENDKEVIKWLKPSKEDLRINYEGDSLYEPDFIVETGKGKFICEIKNADELKDKDVQAKAKCTKEWCQHAAAHEKKHGGKPWSYLLIPHDVISDNMTLKGLVASCTHL